ncbi:hypothetical protein CPLU01_15443 [Colletotrichum plurivorum]|uniref:Uncharacterized protein n=1 Tax=Colletotrichum plurivorum TaxID=2175906 RepID=A0A8H6MVG3_9PEZI|nr:hypothetical protein CPLU01_15443 [Colletotrichum plurivorum]
MEQCLVGIGALTETDDSDLDSDSDSDSQDLKGQAELVFAICFGASLTRLARPIRIFQALSSFRDQCFNILEDEGFTTTGSYDDGSPCFYVEESPKSPHDEGHNRALSHPQQAQSRATERPAGSDGNSSGRDEPSVAETVAPYKRRVSQKYSCPYRKRNPGRFNHRYHAACTMKSFDNMTQLQ